MKNNYIKPCAEIIEFSAVDVICSSSEETPELLTVTINGKTALDYGSSSADIFEA